MTVAGTFLIIAGFILEFVYIFPALPASLMPALTGLAGLFVLGWYHPSHQTTKLISHPSFF